MCPPLPPPSTESVQSSSSGGTPTSEWVLMGVVSSRELTTEHGETIIIISTTNIHIGFSSSFPSHFPPHLERRFWQLIKPSPSNHTIPLFHTYSHQDFMNNCEKLSVWQGFKHIPLICTATCAGVEDYLIHCFMYVWFHLWHCVHIIIVKWHLLGIVFTCCKGLKCGNVLSVFHVMMGMVILVKPVHTTTPLVYINC